MILVDQGPRYLKCCAGDYAGRAAAHHPSGCPALRALRRHGICRPIQRDLPCPVLFAKRFPSRFPKSPLHPRLPVPLQGRIAIVTDAGMGCRWTRSVGRETYCRAGFGLSPEPVSDRTARRRTMLLRTVKPCGPAPVAGVKSAEASRPTGLDKPLIADDVTRRIRRGEERGVSRKPFRAGTPGDRGTRGDLTRVLSTLHARLRVPGTRRSPRPLKGERFSTPRRIAPRGERVFSDGAIHSAPSSAR